MGVTLHGERSVGFALPDFKPDPMDAKWPPNEVALPMRKGDVYVTTPAAILHGVSTQALRESERSVAIQCRTMLDGPSAQFWNAYKTPLNGLVAKLLAEMMMVMPSLEDVKKAEDEIMALWKAKLPNPPETLTIPMFDDQ